VIGYTEIALREPGLSARLRRYLDQIDKAGERASTWYSRSSPLVARPRRNRDR